MEVICMRINKHTKKKLSVCLTNDLSFHMGSVQIVARSPPHDNHLFIVIDGLGGREGSERIE